MVRWRSVEVCIHGITFEVVRTSQQKRIRAKRLLAKAADALVRRETIPFDLEVQEEFDTLQLNESIPYVGIEYIKKAIKAERGRRLVGAGNRQKFVGLGG